jgi:hypothetical protein
MSSTWCVSNTHKRNPAIEGVRRVGKYKIKLNAIRARPTHGVASHDRGTVGEPEGVEVRLDESLRRSVSLHEGGVRSPATQRLDAERA